ncbi:Bug family tripartite tricarboxylate transporter substrate binding protein [Caldovatus aquaticus]|uniref:Tripartite tricarboxylate transporter substrate binding protein n=1 Tax=Caldovatus aquaticus TaxID=2865671 RepID=A0ABS7F1H2_9PROT|nr:tripartite tricarboxylate transporter substrate-binding protein [Caldovatus aquaticus]MBW8268822.1 tripartite tricarboxylate transporter substrate binding protein [Caldovatus aquaticus]
MSALPTPRRLLLATGAAAALPARAQVPQGGDWPARAVRIIVPFGAGGPNDVMARIVAERLRERLGQPFVVENRPGAGGSTGALIASQAAPDGYTFLFHSSAVAIAPALNPRQAIDPRRDLTPVALVADVPMTVVARPEAPGFGSLAEAIATARAAPGRVSVATAGVGSANHLALALLNALAGIETVHVPYRSTAQSVTAVISGEVNLAFAGIVEALGHYRERRVRLLAVTTAERAAALPEVPTIGETVPGYAVPLWFAIWAPPGLPRPILARISAELAAMREVPAVRDRFLALGAPPLMAPPETLAARAAEEVPRWQRVVAEAGIRVE